MYSKVAVFVDWDNIRYLLQSIKRTHRVIDTFDFNDPHHLTELFRSFLEEDETIYRIFFYTAQPLTDDEIRAQLKKRDQKAFDHYTRTRTHSVYDIAMNFLDGMIREPYIALRLGVLKVRGIKHNGSPDMVQKQVDMLMGLDISEVTFNKHAQKILVFSKDTDMKPALKMARINGLEVIVVNFTEMDYLAKELVLHSDLVRIRSLEEIDRKVKGDVVPF